MNVFSGNIEKAETDLKMDSKSCEQIKAEAAKRRVLLVGGAGYIGCPVANLLLESGYKVRNLDLLTYGHQSAMMGQVLSPKYQFQFGNMGCPKSLDEALEGITDVVILAGLVGDPITKKLPDESHQINDIAMKHCLESLFLTL